MEEKREKTFDLTKLKKENFVVIFLIGVLLLVIAWPTENKKVKKEEDKSGITDMTGSTIGVSDEEAELSLAGAVNGGDMLNYGKSLENTLEEILSSMEGAGKVKVMITLQSSGETILEKDTSFSRTSSTEVDSAGGSRNTADITKTEEAIYSGNGKDAPFVKQVIYPRIEGVVVCAQGGGDTAVNKNITEAIQALFGIDVHKIKVIKMSSR